jgi:hypothetical protein
MSFYKEELGGEKDTYIHCRARAANLPLEVVIKDVVDEVTVLIDEVRSILKGQKEKETWEMYVKAYVAWHYLSSRYKLKELLGSEYVPC